MEDFSKDVALVEAIEVVPTILDVVCRTTGMGFAAVARVTDERWIACTVLDHIEFGLKSGGELEIQTTICHEIRQSHDLVVINNVAEDETYSAHHTPLQYGFQSYISVPIILPDGSFFGTLCAIDPKPAVLKNPAIVGMFQMFAQLISFHITAASKLDASEKALEAEMENSKLRDEFIAILSHDLRSPLGSITMGTALLKEGDLETRQGLLVDMMEQGATKMLGLIEDVMDLAHGRLGKGIALGTMAPGKLRPVVEKVIGESRVSWPDREIQAFVELEEPVRHDPKRFGQLITNLISNAIAHGRPDRPVTLTAKAVEGRLLLSISNGADLMSEDVRGRLFEPFFRGDPADRKQGLGLGLYIAAQIARAHGGTLEVDSAEDEMRFVLSMPI